MNAKHVDEILQDLNIETCARILGNTCRFNGRYDYSSVATHSVYVSRLLEKAGFPPDVQMYGLLHDLNEILIGDIVKPIKPHVLVSNDNKLMNVREFEDLLMDQILDLLGHDDLKQTYDHFYKEIKTADTAALLEEKKLINREQTDYQFESPEEGRDSFMNRYRHLAKLMKSAEVNV